MERFIASFPIETAEEIIFDGSVRHARRARNAGHLRNRDSGTVRWQHELESWIARADMANKKMTAQEAYQSETVSDESIEPDCPVLDADCGVSQLRKQPPGPYRSLGGYLDYAEWPERERFMGLDCAIRRQAQERNNADNQTDSEDLQVLLRLQRCSAALASGWRCKNKFRMTPDDTDTKCKGHQTGSSFADALLAEVCGSRGFDEERQPEPKPQAHNIFVAEPFDLLDYIP